MILSPGWPRGDLANLRKPLRRVHHNRDVVAFGLRPEPVGGAVGQPRPVGVAVERQPHAQHAGLVPPALEHVLAGAALERNASHDREAVGIFAHGFERVIVAIGVDRGWHQDGAVDAGAVHVGDQLLIAVGRALGVAGTQRPIQPIRRPHMHLRVDDHQRFNISATRGAK